MNKAPVDYSDRKDDAGSEQPIVYLMRGLPSTGKSHTARRLAGEHGLVCETDAYFYTQVGDDPDNYDYDAALLAAARQWNLERFVTALDAGRSPVVVDRGNGLSLISQIYARRAIERDYRVELREPESSWWAEIRVLLKYPEHTSPILEQWAERLGQLNKSNHRVSAEQIRRRMGQWKSDLTVEEILRYRPRQAVTEASAQTTAAIDEIVVPVRQLLVGAMPHFGAAQGLAGRTSADSAGEGEVLVFDEEAGTFGSN